MFVHADEGNRLVPLIAQVLAGSIFDSISFVALLIPAIAAGAMFSNHSLVMLQSAMLGTYLMEYSTKSIQEILKYGFSFFLSEPSNNKNFSPGHLESLQALYLPLIVMVVNFRNINFRIPGADFPSSCTAVEEHLLPSHCNQNSGLHLPVFWTTQSLFGFTRTYRTISFFAINPENIIPIYSWSLRSRLVVPTFPRPLCWRLPG